MKLNLNWYRGLAMFYLAVGYAIRALIAPTGYAYDKANTVLILLCGLVALIASEENLKIILKYEKWHRETKNKT